MRTTYKTQRKEKEQVKEPVTLSKIFGGDIITSKQALKFYPYILMVVVFIILIIINEQSIAKKQKQIKRYENEYKEVLSKLKKNNQFIPYQESQELLRIIEEKGFQKSDKNRYKIVVTEE